MIIQLNEQAKQVIEDEEKKNRGGVQAVEKDAKISEEGSEEGEEEQEAEQQEGEEDASSPTKQESTLKSKSKLEGSVSQKTQNAPESTKTHPAQKGST